MNGISASHILVHTHLLSRYDQSRLYKGLFSNPPPLISFRKFATCSLFFRLIYTERDLIEVAIHPEIIYMLIFSVAILPPSSRCPNKSSRYDIWFVLPHECHDRAGLVAVQVHPPWIFIFRMILIKQRKKTVSTNDWS